MRRFLLLISLVSAAYGQQVIRTIAGADWVFPSAEQPALEAPIGRVASVAIDRSGNLYAADESNHMVMKVTPQGRLSVVAGNGFRGFSGDRGLAVNASLSGPRGIAVDRDGNVYVSDSGNHRIRKVTPDGFINTLAGNGVAVYAGDGGPATSASLNTPIDLAADADGNVYIADIGSNRVRVVNRDGVIRTFAGSGAFGNEGDGQPARQAQLNLPIAVAVDPSTNTVYITDWLNHRVRRVTTDGIIRAFAGNGENAQARLVETGPAIQATLAFPRQVTIDTRGNVYITDPGTHRIRRVTPGGQISTIVGNGVEGLTGDDGPAAAAKVAGPTGIAADPNGNLYIADTENLRIRRVTPDLVMQAFAGNGQFRAAPQTGAPAHLANLASPRGLAVDLTDTLVFTSTDQHRIFSYRDATIKHVAGNGTRPSLGNGGPATDAGLNVPSGIAFDTANNMFVADQFNGQIRKITPEGIISIFAVGSLRNGLEPYPTGLAVDANGTIFVADRQHSLIRRITAAGVQTVYAGTGTPGYAGDNGPAVNARLSLPAGVSLDRAGNLYIADTQNSRIRRVGLDGTIRTIAGTGEHDYFGDGGAPERAALKRPSGVFVDPSGDIYIADTGNNAIRKISGNIITTVAGTGQTDFYGDGGLPTDAALHGPQGVTVDRSGNILISDTENNRIRMISTMRPQVQTSSAEISLTASADGATSTAEALDLLSSLPGVPYSIATQTENGGSWLKTTTTTGRAPATIHITANPAALAAGDYSGSITITAPSAEPGSLTIPVKFTVLAPEKQRLAAEPEAISFVLPERSPLDQKEMWINNKGEGWVGLNVEAKAEEGKPNWLRAAVRNSFANGNNAAPITIAADPAGLEPGAYKGTVVVTGETVAALEVPVSLNVLPSQRASMQLSQQGLTFRASAGGGDLPQCFAVLNVGGGTLTPSVTAQTTAGGNWLQAAIGPCPYSSVAVIGGRRLTEVVVSVTPGSLSPGEYQGTIDVNAADTDNAPQSVSVRLSVLPAGTPVGLVPRPAGVFFVMTQGQAPPGSQDITVFNPTTRSYEFSAVSGAFSAKKWFAYVPDKARVSAFPATAAVIRVQPDVVGLNPGVLRNTITLNSELGSREISVVSVVTAAGVSGAQSKTQRSADAACFAGELHALFTQVEAEFTAASRAPFPLEVAVFDNCGAPLTKGSVVVAFSTNEAPTNLRPLGDGRWSGTWVPRAEQAGRVNMIARVSDPARNLRAEITVSGSVGAPDVVVREVVSASDTGVVEIRLMNRGNSGAAPFEVQAPVDSAEGFVTCRMPVGLAAGDTGVCRVPVAGGVTVKSSGRSMVRFLKAN